MCEICCSHNAKYNFPSFFFCLFCLHLHLSLSVEKFKNFYVLTVVNYLVFFSLSDNGQKRNFNKLGTLFSFYHQRGFISLEECERELEPSCFCLVFSMCKGNGVEILFLIVKQKKTHER